MKTVLVVVITLLANAGALAHESDRDIQLKATNDELTKRVAELLDENAKLKAHVTDIVKQMREAPNSKKVIIGGCNPQGIYENLMLEFASHNRNNFLEPWLQENGKQCTEKDFEFIEGTLLREVTFTSRAEELIRYFRSIR